MKRILSFLIVLNILGLNFALASEVLVDDFLTNTLDKNLKVQKYKYVPIEDNLASDLPKNLKVEKYIDLKLQDNLANKLPKNLAQTKYNYKPINDELVLYIDKTKIKELNQQKVNLDLDKSSIYKIKVSPSKYQTTRRNLYEGDYIDFILREDVEINNITYKKGTKIKARVETISKNGAYGVPADLVVGNFTLPNNQVLNGQIERQGANRALWVYPVGYMLTPFFLLGLFIFPIRGGHAKLYARKVYEVEI